MSKQEPPPVVLDESLEFPEADSERGPSKALVDVTLPNGGVVPVPAGLVAEAVGHGILTEEEVAAGLTVQVVDGVVSVVTPGAAREMREAEARNQVARNMLGVFAQREAAGRGPYAGTVSSSEKARRRAKGKLAKASRKKNR